MAIANTLHLLSAVIWVGGMFFAYMMLRPVRAACWNRPFAYPFGRWCSPASFPGYGWRSFC